jgi:hypothetical protein
MVSLMTGLSIPWNGFFDMAEKDNALQEANGSKHTKNRHLS